MKTSNKLILATILISSITFVSFFVSSKGNKETSEIGTTANFSDLLKSKEHEMWQKLTSNEIDKHECEKLTEEIAQKPTDAKDQGELLSKDMLELISEVLKSFGISIDAIIICLADSESPAMAKDNVLYINQKTLATYTINAQKFIIAHEAQHMIHKDYSCRSAAYKMIQKKIKGNWQTENPDYPLNDLIYFSEIRADIQAALKKEEYAQGYLDFAQTLMNDEDEKYNPGTTHPKADYRLSLAQNIQQQHALKSA